VWVLGFVAGIVIRIINTILENVIPLIDSTSTWDNDVTESLTNAWNALPSDIICILEYIQVPELISIVTGAYLYVWIRNKVPFIGK
jgi:hypothetical protein